MPSAEFPPRNVLCVGAVITAGPRVLLVREKVGRLAGQWSIPWGYVEAGEPPDEAAARETLEEAGVTVMITALLGSASLRNPAGAVALVFAGTLDPADQVPHADGTETTEAQFFAHPEVADESLPVEPWCRWVALRAMDGRHHSIPRTLDGPSPLPTFL